MTWGVVLYPAWDEWSEPDPGIRAAVESWFAKWVTEGPPNDAERISRFIEAAGTELTYMRTAHAPTGVVATFITGTTGEQPYAAISKLRSPRRRTPRSE